MLVMKGLRGSSRIFAGVLLGAVLFGSLTGCAAESTRKAEHRDTLLTVSKAGEKYLAAVCPLNQLWGEAAVEIDALRLTLSRGTPDASRVQVVFGKLSEATDSAIAAFQDPGVRWPKKMQKALPALLASLGKDKEQLTALAASSAKKVANYQWQGKEASAAASAKAREAVGLPADPAVACGAWEEQQRLLEQKAKKSKQQERSKEAGTQSSADSASAES